jgi:hypothetical protein
MVFYTRRNSKGKQGYKNNKKKKGAKTDQKYSKKIEGGKSFTWKELQKKES